MCNILDTSHDNIIHLREPKTEILPPSSHTHPYLVDGSQTAISFTHSDIKYFLKTFPNNPLICTDNSLHALIAQNRYMFLTSEV